MKEAIKTGRGWQLAIAGLIGTFLVASALSFLLAGKRVSRVVDVDYYSHGLRYNEHQQQAQRGAQWALTPTVSREALQVGVQNLQGDPVSGGRLEFVPEPGGKPLPLPERAPGIYAVPLPAGNDSDLHGRLDFRKGDAVLSKKVVLFRDR